MKKKTKKSISKIQNQVNFYLSTSEKSKVKGGFIAVDEIDF